MHIFRWLMSHPIITAWILAALAILLNMNMGSKSEHSEVEHDKNGVSHVVESDKASAAGQENMHAVAIEHTAPTPASGEEAVKAVDDAPAVHTHSAELKAKWAEKEKSTVTEGAAADSSSAEANNIKVEASTNTQEASSESSANNKAGLAAVANAPEGSTAEGSSTEDLIAMSSDDLLKLAREAFWQNKKDKSAAIYQALVKRVPSSLDYKGELANVLWHQNKQKESAALYAEIAMPMLKEGKSREVSNMLGFIGVFFPEKASEIHRAMSE